MPARMKHNRCDKCNGGDGESATTRARMPRYSPVSRAAGAWSSATFDARICAVARVGKGSFANERRHCGATDRAGLRLCWQTFP